MRIDWVKWGRFAAIAARHAVTRALLFLLILLINPFGIAEWGDLRSHDVWQRIYADHYGDRSEVGRNAITVVELDEQGMQAAAPSDASPDSIHLLEIFRTVAEGDNGPDGRLRAHGKPEAMFIDLLLGDFAPDGMTQAELLDFAGAPVTCPGRLGATLEYAQVASPFRCMLRGIADITRYDGPKGWKDDKGCLKSELAKLHCILKRGGTPVMIASAVDPKDKRAAVEKPGAAALATIAISVPIMVNDRRYPLVFPVEAAQRENRPFTLHPAAMLYAAYCATNGCKDDPSIAPAPEEAKRTGAAWLDDWRWPTAFETPVEVIWGVGKQDRFTNQVDSLAHGTTGSRCRVADPSRGGTFRAFMQALFSGLRIEPQAACAYQHSVSYGLLRLGKDDPAQLAAFRQSALAGKIVLIGMSTRDSNDYVSAGPHGQLPGVFYHAMALDNLIERGAAYPRVARQMFPPFTLSDQDVTNAIGAFLMLLFGGAVVARQRLFGKPDDAEGSVRLMIEGAIFLAAAIVYMVLILYILTRQVSVLPDRFNLAALSIVIVLEFFNIMGILLAPIWNRLDVSRAVILLFPGLKSSGSAAAGPAKVGDSNVVDPDRTPRRRRRRTPSDGVQGKPADDV